ncbi:MAG TPA: hypothetical protein H9902_15430 [Candidatus Stackebrandtia faecavium]|nr:hypothetical protein [Candidatus Stackebrandtia faecavium]
MSVHRLSRRLIAVTIMACGLVLIPTHTAVADPDGGHSVGEDLDKAIEDYIEAEDKLDQAEKSQDEIKEEISYGKKKIKELKVQVAEFAESAYANGGIPSASVVLSSGSPEKAVGQMSIVNYLGDQSAKALQDLIDAKDELKSEQEALEDEIKSAENATKKLEDARDAAARQVAANGGESVPGPSPGDFRKADPAPRGPGGSLPSEGCSVDDPTTSGCLTPRTEHALNQAVIAGFQRYVSCYRSTEDGGEHPRGQACDFSSDVGSFGGYAQGEAKTYGDNLAAWFVENADALGVKYVIWFNQIWQPGSGWTSYPGCGGSSPSCDHTNHVHLSIL